MSNEQTIQDVTTPVHVDLQAVDFEARCDCGHPIAGFHHVLAEGSIDTAHLAAFFAEAHQLHIAANDDGQQSHVMQVALANPQMTTRVG